MQNKEILTPERVVAADNQELATILSLEQLPNLERTEFITKPDHDLQIGIVPLKRGEVKALHTHPSVDGGYLQEIWLVLQGTVELKLMDDDGVAVNRELKKGDLVHIAGGPHGLKAVENSRILLIKESEGQVSAKNLK